MKSSSPIHLPCPQSDLVEPRGRPHSGAQQHTKLAVDQDQASSGGLLLQLPEVHTLEQAWQQVDHLQQQAYFKTRKLNGKWLNHKLQASWSCSCSSAPTMLKHAAVSPATLQALHC